MPERVSVDGDRVRGGRATTSIARIRTVHLGLAATLLAGLAAAALLADDKAPPPTAAPPAAPATTKSPDAAKPASTPTPPAGSFTQKIDGTTHEMTFVPLAMPAKADGGNAEKSAPKLWIASTETTWDLYDVFLFGFDQKDGKSGSADADAVTRPSKPYISMDRGFGHAGYPAISVSYLGAKKFCEWLSAKTGKKYRLPTVAEWQQACATAAIPSDRVAEFAWFADNANGKTHAVATTKAGANGCFDLYGNASEWCTQVDDKGNAKGVTLGGMFKDKADAIGCASIVPYTPDWNASDPQYPKSKWWLADGGFVGFRVVCEE
ncbi:MAG: SUMF1/EgtB/PvdO family nonheme iron enzyme [Phycisphaerae bacterium]|nr:SUMF1/EgtB/PvdO family nonheme iron enzyme [Phycisphaerae bacterium]